MTDTTYFVRTVQPTRLHRWYSICSRHREHRDDCRMCSAGSWYFEPRLIVERAVFKVAPKVWQRWANR